MASWKTIPTPTSCSAAQHGHGTGHAVRTTTLTGLGPTQHEERTRAGARPSTGCAVGRPKAVGWRKPPARSTTSAAPGLAGLVCSAPAQMRSLGSDRSRNPAWTRAIRTSYDVDPARLYVQLADSRGTSLQEIRDFPNFLMTLTSSCVVSKSGPASNPEDLRPQRVQIPRMPGSRVLLGALLMSTAHAFSPAVPLVAPWPERVCEDAWPCCT